MPEGRGLVADATQTDTGTTGNGTQTESHAVVSAAQTEPSSADEDAAVDEAVQTLLPPPK